MASQGPLLAGAGADDAAVGTVAWSNPGNIVASDDARAATGAAASFTSHYLNSSSHGFSIPSGATIDGIVVSIERRQQTGSAAIEDSRVRIVKGGTVGATDKAATGVQWPVPTEAAVSYGSSSDLWGESWTPADINASTFGAALSVVNPTANSRNAQVDAIRITVYYTAGGAALTQNLSDTVTASDAVGKAAGKPTSDTLTASDAAFKGSVLGKADSVTASDAVAKAPGLGPADTLTATDLLALAEGFHLGLADTLTASDDLARAWAAGRSLDDSLALVDVIRKAAGQAHADSLTASDTVTTDVGQTEAEGAFEWFESAVAMTGLDMESDLNLTR